MKGDAFSMYHPLAGFLFFALVLVISMCVLHPAEIMISFTAALAYCVCLRGARPALGALVRLLPLMGLAALLNAAFNHRGVTILAYLPSGNPLTAESILYGVAAAGRLGAVLLWFSCCSEVMTEDKLLYLFGRVSPALSLLLSMTLRFVPRFRARFRAAYELRRGEAVRVTNAIRAFSATVTWALEHGVETADSMRGRGYGLEKRTAFSLYRLEARDVRLLAWLVFCGILLLLCACAEGFAWRWFPRVTEGGLTHFGMVTEGVWFALCLTPVALCGKEAGRWKRIGSMT